MSFESVQEMFSRTAAMDTAISGKEVAIARKKVPTKDCPRPVCAEMPSAKCGRNKAAKTVMAAKTE